MRATSQEATGSAGVSDVMSNFRRIGWAPVENPQSHDLGTDIWVAVRDERRFDLGRVLGVQVKAGTTYFKNVEADAQGNVLGWWYYESTTDHFDYWIKHLSPHLLILHNLESRTSHWVHITAPRCVTTGKGVRILVPRDQTIDSANFTNLLTVAAKQSATISLEGTAYDAAAYNVAPVDRVRYAMLIPRILSPHPNRGLELQIEPEEALALIVKCDIAQLRDLVQRTGLWTDPDTQPMTEDWRWHFVYACWRALAHSDTSLLAGVIETSQRLEWRVGACILLASRYYEEGQTQAALDLVQSMITEDKCVPADHSWLLLHQAWYGSELGHLQDARDAAQEAQNLLQREPSDATASMLLGCSARTLYFLQDFGSQSADDLSRTIRASDNVGSWWRDQQMGWTYSQAATADFKAWAEDTSSHWEADPPIHGFLAATWNSSFCADFESYAAAKARLGCYELRHANTSEELTQGLMNLLLSGDTKAFGLACKKLSRNGPATVLTNISSICIPPYMTRKRARCFLEFWTNYAHTADEVSARKMMDWCIGVLTGTDASLLVQDEIRVQKYSVVDALAGSLEVLGASDRTKASTILESCPVSTVFDHQAISRLAKAIGKNAQSTETANFILSSANSAAGSTDAMVKARLMRLAYDLGSADAKRALLDEATRPNYYAAAEALSADILSHVEATQVIRHLSYYLQISTLEASSGKHGLSPSLSKAELLTALNINFPEHAEWDVLASYLIHPAVLADNKAAACRRIAAQRERVPVQTRNRIVEGLDQLARSVYLPDNALDTSAPKPLATDLAILMRAALVGIDDAQIAALLAGDVRNRFRAFELMYFHPDERFDFLMLQNLREGPFTLRRGSAQLAGRRAARSANDPLLPALRASLELVALDLGTEIPLALLRNLNPPVASAALHALQGLVGHPSIRVRREMERISQAE